MQLRFPPALRRAFLLCLLPIAWVACDRHPAGEPPENYGHGSSREKSFENHAIDSTGAKHFSDSAGAGKEGEHGAEAGKAEDASPAPKRLNPE